MARFTHTHLDEATASASLSSPNASTSDKENSRHGIDKRSKPAMPPSRHQEKRRRLADRDLNSQHSHDDKKYYDPDQDMQVRRGVRRNYRDRTRDLNDNRDEFMRPGTERMTDFLRETNELYANVKQTADATLDSRLLVNAADVSYKKAARLALGDTSAGIDVDEFVSKCMSFMRRSPNNVTGSSNGTQARTGRYGRSQRDPEASDEDDSGDAMNWDTLGRLACFPYNARPAVSGWLLGPLSLQKRMRQHTQRTRQEQIDPTQAVGPQELAQKDLGQQENANLTEMCSDINKLLAKTQDDGMKQAEAELGQIEDPTPEQVQDIMNTCNVADDGGIPLFRFCINPKSFGQSVENLFYVSFLVRDGTVGVSTDSRGLPTLHAAAPFAPSDAQKRGIQKHQTVFSLDYETWKDLIKVFDIKKSIISPRKEAQVEVGTSWYG